MSQFFAILTAVGEAKLANAAALGRQLQLTSMAVGDGNGAPTVPVRTQTALVRERRRALLNSLFIDPLNANQIVAEQVIPEDVGDFWIREGGLYDAAGDLCAVANFPDTYKPLLSSGSGRTQVIRMVLIVSSTSAVTLKVDPAVVLATKGELERAIAAHMSADDPHPQYLTESEGAAKIAQAVAELVAASPASLDTLKELAAALGNDPNFATTMMNALSGKAEKGWVTDQLSKAAGIPLLLPLWCPNRAAIPAGYAPADGQTLARSLYPDAWAGFAAGSVPTAADATWLSTPTERGKFTAGDGVSTFRLPDYNGKAAGSLGALFMRGDGAASAGADGVIQQDAVQGHKHNSAEYPGGLMNGSIIGAGQNGSGNAPNVLATAAYPAAITSSPIGDGVNGTPRTASETRPLNVTGCWAIRLFGAVTNPGVADAAQLATEVARLWSQKAERQSVLGAGYMLVRDERASGVNAGSSVIGIQTRVLNTVQSNTISGATLANNQITLPPGTYRVRAQAPAYTNTSKTFVYDVTGGMNRIIGRSVNGVSGAAGDQAESVSEASGRFTITAPTIFELRHYISEAVATIGLGAAVSQGTEVYSSVEIIQE